MRGGLALAGGTDPDVACPFPQFGEGRGAEIAHAGLNAADQLGQQMVEIVRDLLERLDALGGDLCLLYTSPSPRDAHESRMPSSA